VVCTGGEPLLQLDEALVEAFHREGFEVAIETNGTLPVPAWGRLGLREPEGRVAPVVVRSGDELKLVIPQEGLDPVDFEGWSFEALLRAALRRAAARRAHAPRHRLVPGPPEVAALAADPQAPGHPMRLTGRHVVRGVHGGGGPALGRVDCTGRAPAVGSTRPPRMFPSPGRSPRVDPEPVLDGAVDEWGDPIKPTPDIPEARVDAGSAPRRGEHPARRLRGRRHGRLRRRGEALLPRLDVQQQPPLRRVRVRRSEPPAAPGTAAVLRRLRLRPRASPAAEVNCGATASCGASGQAVLLRARRSASLASSAPAGRAAPAAPRARPCCTSRDARVQLGTALRGELLHPGLRLPLVSIRRTEMR
jgi:hypothetical protein